MFSLDNFYQIISQNLFAPFDICTADAFSKFGSTDFNDIETVYSKTLLKDSNSHVLEHGATKQIIFYDQEPVYARHLTQQLLYNSKLLAIDYYFSYGFEPKYFNSNLFLFANSEYSQEKTDFLKDVKFQDWYYFFHGFAALDWYRNIRYMPPIKNYSKVFISFNNLCSEKRSYRLNLVARLIEANLNEHGYISLNHNQNLIKNEIFNTNSLLSLDSKKLIVRHLQNHPRLKIDTFEQHGALSANDDLAVMCQGLWHVVTETIFYDSKYHLTEKIFKPIVARRPFILVGAPGNLEYLRSYGFRTFDQWIDESYDSETDPDQRIIKIVAEIQKLCQLSSTELDTMYQEMQEVIDYNYNWFYGGFKQYIVNELVDNFHRCIIQHNVGRDASFKNYIHYPIEKLQDVKNRLAQ